jgi:predicted nucleic acid-binding protein
VIFDASCLLNLAHGNVLGLVRQLSGVSIEFGHQVYRECRTIQDELNDLITERHATVLNDAEIPAGRFADLLARYGLGSGETECIVLAEMGAKQIACDDGKARACIVDVVGPDRLTGSIGLLLSLGRAGLLSPSQVRIVHTMMRQKGGFLPDL